MKAQQIREAFLNFFADRDHKIIRSSPLLPQNDPTILFTNAGMNQFKNVFLGLEKRSYKRAASVQKCMRVSGKHNDLEQVGITNKHHTFFEMLGNFSFGDYFKKDAIDYAWGLITEVYRMPKDRLYATVYLDDDEAYELWNKRIGLPADRIFRFGKKDNYWAMGETGPCGPCSELHYDLGESMEEGTPHDLIENGSDRFLELWNLVFMQFDQDDKGQLKPLPSPSIDTGMGLERVATVLQGKTNNYDTDLFLPLIEAVCDFSGREYLSGEEGDTAARVIADHVRAVSFLIGDGIMPSNEGRGYVLRRLIRRAYRYGNSIGLDEPFLYKLVGGVTDIMKDAYPELLPSVEYISKVCLSEENRFALTLSSGLKTFDQYIDELKETGQTVLSGEKLFKLYDTFGFPIDLSEELALERDIAVDRKGFLRELEEQRHRARLSWKGDAEDKDKKAYETIRETSVEFIGYDSVKSDESEVLALLKSGKQIAAIKEGESAEVVLDRTPFYAEAGGQVGDSGTLKNPHFSALVKTTYYPIPDIISHKVQMLSGILRVGDVLEAVVDLIPRNNIRRNHTATHLLHASLRQILGDHVKQAGSLVSSDRLRFDFTHFTSLSDSEIRQIEYRVNEKIRDGIDVATAIVSLEEGIGAGATAIFEEKYGEKVRMVSIDDFSRELCGGIHVANTGEIGMFKIVSESSVAAGMRRIEALTGEEALKDYQENVELLEDIQRTVNSPRKDILQVLDRMKESLKEKEKEARAIRQKLAKTRYQEKGDLLQEVKGIRVKIQRVEELSTTELRELADSLKQKIGSGVVILGGQTGEKAYLVSAVTKDLIDRISAVDIIRKIAPLVGGGGGGRPDFAQAGGPEVGKLDHALERAPKILEGLLQ
ncbi:MAG: alanine--tRNA ligase [Candidatus Aminicenantes bacterium]|jgi:alanyl-tRNA synthetase